MVLGARLCADRWTRSPRSRGLRTLGHTLRTPRAQAQPPRTIHCALTVARAQVRGRLAWRAAGASAWAAAGPSWEAESARRRAALRPRLAAVAANCKSGSSVPAEAGEAEARAERKQARFVLDVSVRT